MRFVTLSIIATLVCNVFSSPPIGQKQQVAFVPTSRSLLGSTSQNVEIAHPSPTVPVYPKTTTTTTTTTTTSLYFFQDLLKSFAPKSEEGKTSPTKQQINDYDEPIAEALTILNTAAETKSQDPESVVSALEDLEKLMRKKCKAEPNNIAAQEILKNLNGSWRLIFTTGTKTTQDRIKKTVNYFPIKAVQSFDTTTGEPFGIENGIYVGDLAIVKFAGPFDFNLLSRKLEFDFTKISVFGLTINIKSGDAAKIGASTGLGSESNVKNSEKGKRPFFNWISADENIATARGGGGGLALWKRIDVAEE